jgi:hypothetical protein
MPENIAYTKTENPSQSNGQLSVGQIVFPATVIVATDFIEVDVGFRPKHVVFSNTTDRVEGEYFEGMAANTCIKTVAAGTRTLEVSNGGITLTDNGFRVSQNATLALVLASKTCHYIAQA